ncbi:MAG: hypothetical protein ACM3QS_16955 [Bacteroidota bacterium]
MMRRHFIPSLILLAAWTLAACSIADSSTSATPGSAARQAFVPGNYCVSCHLADDARLLQVTEWKGGIGRESSSPCPAATRIHEELYYTERLLLMIDRTQASVGSLPDKEAIKLDGYTQLYSRQLDEPVTSLEAFTAEAGTARYRLNKIHSALNAAAEQGKRRTILFYAGAITLVVLGSLAWGLYNTRAVHSPRKGLWLSWRLVPAVAMLVLFALPIFRVPAAQVAPVTTEQQAAQTVLDTADRAASAADRAQARAWMLADVANAWSHSGPPQARMIFEEALTSLRQARGNAQALWGQSLSVQEATIGVPIDMQKGRLIALDLNAARARAWSTPLIALDLSESDPARAAALLRAEEDRAEGQTGTYRDLQLRAVALAWVRVEASQALPAARAIQDASIGAWTLRELASLMNNASLFGLAAEAARQVEDPVQRARALREVGAAAKDQGLLTEARSALERVTGAERAYALSDLAAASGDATIVEDIDLAYPDARAVALLRLGEYQAAWEASEAITDPYERARAEAAIAGAWGNAQAAAGIGVRLYRDAALRDVIVKTGDPEAAASIRSPYYRVQAFTVLGDPGSAIRAASGLADSYPLIDLISSLAGKDPQKALALVDSMSREADKAAALRVLAAATRDPSVIEQARGMALAARVRGDSLSPVRASLELAEALWTVDPVQARAALQQAYETALRISAK